MKISAKLFIVSVTLLCVYTACSNDKLSDEATVELIDYQEAFLAKHQAVFNSILEDDFVTYAEFETITKLEGYEAFNNTPSEELNEEEVTNLQVEAIGKLSTAQRRACYDKFNRIFVARKAKCKTRKKKNRAACKKIAARSFLSSTQACNEFAF